jgi:hypothetical protein
VQEVILNARGTPKLLYSKLTVDDKTNAMNALTKLALGDPSHKNHIINLPFTGRVYKTLVQGGHYSTREKRIEGTAQPQLS